MISWNDRRRASGFKNPSVEAAAKAGSIIPTKKSPSKLSQKIAKKMYPAGIPNMPKKGK
jgi:hypothetical protein